MQRIIYVLGQDNFLSGTVYNEETLKLKSIFIQDNTSSHFGKLTIAKLAKKVSEHHVLNILTSVGPYQFYCESTDLHIKI